MSFVLIIDLVHPCLTASAICKNILVSASSCVQGSRLAVLSLGGVKITLSLIVLHITLFSVVTEQADFARKVNSSILFLSFLKKLNQLCGVLVSGKTRRRTRAPLLSLVVLFRLSSGYVSHTRSSLSVDSSLFYT